MLCKTTLYHKTLRVQPCMHMWVYIELFFFLKQKHIIYYSIKLPSWNKTSLAIGGTSSIQYIFSEVFLANWANTWATRFPPLLTQSILTHNKLWIKCWISSTTFTTKDWSIFIVEIVVMTELLSPSITNSEKPASTANSIRSEERRVGKECLE